ncbi:stringent starvation protein B [Sulfuritortus calidifontis]|uniref:Stringent starvation protein B n=1 Tax=Sulfuritortus calidifontis TaxID=1914471 RepID=A0A4R3JUY8_9PROT|nr:ClpXP protease specificity-enhancing factor [Sulfuritortus calidifontis]TCS71659.1 stringent starvation protein B [Sulfuritortus calidifontis]
MSELPQQPYFLRALYEWCVDCGYTPHIAVRVDARCKVPAAYVKDGQIVLNIGPNAVRNLLIDNDWVSFSARFGGVAQDIQVPVANVLSIYARETGEGMAFSQADTAAVAQDAAIADQPQPETTTDPTRPKGRPTLRVVK